MKEFFAMIAAVLAMAAQTVSVSAQTVTTGPQQQSAVVERPATSKVGSSWTYRSFDGRSGLVTYEDTRDVVEVSGDSITFTMKATNGAITKVVEAIDTNVISQIPETGNGWYRYAPNNGQFAFPLTVGKTYAVKNKYETGDGYRGSQDLEAKVVGWEQVTVPAGTFSALKITIEGWFESHEVAGVKGGSGRVDKTVWYAPAVGRMVKQEYKDTYWGGRSVNQWNKTELVAYKLAP